ncbi:MAG: hypothetical protein EAX96_11720 [Candidatus Lokiarchaeota archaeon]|nr:hypothetical protein [Candidatus Lokiarchaeota archaeon]
MKKHRIKLINLILIVLLTLNISSLIVSDSLAYSDSAEYVILFDEAHGQFFNYNNMQTAYLMLNDSGNYEVQRLTGNQNLTTEVLSNVEILVIGAPDKNVSRNYTDVELNSIKDFVNNGGSLFLLNNPNYSTQIPEFNYTNTNHTFMNQILDSFNLVNIRFLNETIKAPTGGFYYVNYRFQLVLTSSNLDPISPISLGINNILTFSSAIQCTDPNLVVGQTVAGSKTEPLGIVNPYWLVARDFQPGGRILICGSMQMFSDLSPFLLSSKWINPQYSNLQFDNSKLWMNIFSWLSQENNTLISSTIFLILNIGIIGACAFLIVLGKRKRKVETPSEIEEKEEKIIEEEEKEDLNVLINQRAKLLKSARIFIKNHKYEKVSEYYEKAANLTKSIDDDKNLYDTYIKKSKKYKEYK